MKKSEYQQSGLIRPLIRWAGSKRKLIPILRMHLPAEFERYVEPFAGSACLFFELSPKPALIGDINEELINAYIQVKNRRLLMIDLLTNMPDTSEENYYRQRSVNPLSLNKLERAARFIFLNRLCFNGLYRTNMKGEFNVPYGGGRSGDLPTPSEITNASKVFRSAKFIAGSFEKVLSEVKTGDFVYLDPPYSIANRRVFNNYSHDVFGMENLRVLRSELERLDKIGVQFLLSYGLSKEGIELAKGFKTKHALVQRQISGFATHRRKAREMLVTNY
ncbi:MAG TPA: Dam family site-specific DNA-(adenine-N6)-methyltransferase [Usitatibacteraceae bacterium]